MQHNPGNKISITIEDCACGSKGRELVFELMFYSPEHDLWVAKMPDKPYYAVVQVDENENAICQKAGTYSWIAHEMYREENPDFEPGEDDDESEGFKS